MDQPDQGFAATGPGPVLLGEDDFGAIADDHGFFIDKSLFIKEFMESNAKITAILRPRRFGKSTNLTMLRSFLSRDAYPGSFETLEIANYPKFIEQHSRKYPVIYLSWNGCYGETWDRMKGDLWVAVREMTHDHIEAIKADTQFLCHLDFSQNEPPANFADVLAGLIDAVYAKFNLRIIVLVDEYDGPLSVAHRNGFYAKAAAFFSTFYSRAFKNRYALRKACLMGIFEVGGAGFRSGLNNVEVVTVCDEKFAKYFGFTKEEIAPYAQDQLQEIIDWYNGYRIGGLDLINPWSFTYWLSNRITGLYWAGSSKVENLSTELSDHWPVVLRSAIDLAFNIDSSIQLTNLPESVNYELSSLPSGLIWYFLIFAGYLTFKPALEGSHSGFASVPNREVRQYWQEELALVVSSSLRSIPNYLSNLTEALQNYKLETLRSLLEELLLGASCYDLPRENSYHCIIYTTLQLLFLGDEQIAQVSSNKESGEGRYDIAIFFPKLMRCIIFKFKKTEAETDLIIAAKAGLAQIIENDYSSRFPGCKCYLVAMAFFRKNISIFETNTIDVPTVIKRLTMEEYSIRRSKRIRKH